MYAATVRGIYLTAYFKASLRTFSITATASTKSSFPENLSVFTLLDLKHKHLSRVFSELPPKGGFGSLNTDHKQAY